MAGCGAREGEQDKEAVPFIVSECSSSLESSFNDLDNEDFGESCLSTTLGEQLSELQTEDDPDQSEKMKSEKETHQPSSVLVTEDTAPFNGEGNFVEKGNVVEENSFVESKLFVKSTNPAAFDIQQLRSRSHQFPSNLQKIAEFGTSLITCLSDSPRNGPRCNDLVFHSPTTCNPRSSVRTRKPRRNHQRHHQYSNPKRVLLHHPSIAQCKASRGYRRPKLSKFGARDDASHSVKRGGDFDSVDRVCSISDFASVANSESDILFHLDRDNQIVSMNSSNEWLLSNCSASVEFNSSSFNSLPQTTSQLESVTFISQTSSMLSRCDTPSFQQPALSSANSSVDSFCSISPSFKSNNHHTHQSINQCNSILVQGFAPPSNNIPVSPSSPNSIRLPPPVKPRRELHTWFWDCVRAPWASDRKSRFLSVDEPEEHRLAPTVCPGSQTNFDKTDSRHWDNIFPVSEALPVPPLEHPNSFASSAFALRHPSTADSNNSLQAGLSDQSNLLSENSHSQWKRLRIDDGDHKKYSFSQLKSDRSESQECFPCLSTNTWNAQPSGIFEQFSFSSPPIQTADIQFGLDRDLPVNVFAQPTAADSSSTNSKAITPDGNCASFGVLHHPTEDREVQSQFNSNLSKSEVPNRGVSRFLALTLPDLELSETAVSDFPHLTDSPHKSLFIPFSKRHASPKMDTPSEKVRYSRQNILRSSSSFPPSNHVTVPSFSEFRRSPRSLSAIASTSLDLSQRTNLFLPSSIGPAPGSPIFYMLPSRHAPLDSVPKIRIPRGRSSLNLPAVDIDRKKGNCGSRSLSPGSSMVRRSTRKCPEKVSDTSRRNHPPRTVKKNDHKPAAPQSSFPSQPKLGSERLRSCSDYSGPFHSTMKTSMTEYLLQLAVAMRAHLEAFCQTGSTFEFVEQLSLCCSAAFKAPLFLAFVHDAETDELVSYFPSAGRTWQDALNVIFSDRDEDVTMQTSRPDGLALEVVRVSGKSGFLGTQFRKLIDAEWNIFNLNGPTYTTRRSPYRAPAEASYCPPFVGDATSDSLGYRSPKTRSCDASLSPSLDPRRFRRTLPSLDPDLPSMERPVSFTSASMDLGIAEEREDDVTGDNNSAYVSRHLQHSMSCATSVQSRPSLNPHYRFSVQQPPGMAFGSDSEQLSKLIPIPINIESEDGRLSRRPTMKRAPREADPVLAEFIKRKLVNLSYENAPTTPSHLPATQHSPASGTAVKNKQHKLFSARDSNKRRKADRTSVPIPPNSLLYSPVSRLSLGDVTQTGQPDGSVHPSKLKVASAGVLRKKENLQTPTLPLLSLGLVDNQGRCRRLSTIFNVLYGGLAPTLSPRSSNSLTCGFVPDSEQNSENCRLSLAFFRAPPHTAGRAALQDETIDEESHHSSSSKGTRRSRQLTLASPDSSSFSSYNSSIGYILDHHRSLTYDKGQRASFDNQSDDTDPSSLDDLCLTNVRTELRNPETSGGPLIGRHRSPDLKNPILELPDFGTISRVPKDSYFLTRRWSDGLLDMVNRKRWHYVWAVDDPHCRYAQHEDDVSQTTQGRQNNSTLQGLHYEFSKQHSFPIIQCASDASEDDTTSDGTGSGNSPSLCISNSTSPQQPTWQSFLFHRSSLNDQHSLNTPTDYSSATLQSATHSLDHTSNPQQNPREPAPLPSSVPVLSRTLFDVQGLAGKVPIGMLCMVSPTEDSPEPENFRKLLDHVAYQVKQWLYLNFYMKSELQ